MTLARPIPMLIDVDGTYEVAETLDLVHVKSGRRTIVHQGFRSDLASVPRFLSWLTPIAGVHNLAALRHDRNCVELAEAFRAGRKPDITSIETDGMFLDDLLELGVPVYRARAYWVGVRFGAAANKARRPGWWSTFAELLLWTILLLPVVPAGLLVWLTLTLGRITRLFDLPRARRLRATKETYAGRRTP